MACRVYVHLRQLGLVNYSRVLALQESLVLKYKDIQEHGDKCVGELLLCEHSPVYTFGLREKPEEDEVNRLTHLGAEVFKVRRGGLTTFHGPGQLICYPVVNLRLLKLGVKEYFHHLEKAVIATIAHFGVTGYTTDRYGVWVTDREGKESKICALGIQVRHAVSFHGLGVNCSTELSWFNNINPCGDDRKAVTSLSEVCQRIILPCDVEPVLTKFLAYTIGFSLK